MSRLQDLERLLEKDFDEIEQSFNGEYADELKKLSGLSVSDIEKIQTNTDMVTYEKLKAVVLRASLQNLSQAELKLRIKKLGHTAIEIAKLADIIV